jgi:hypothetical protein
MGASPSNLDWTDQGPWGGCASIAFRNGFVGFFPLPPRGGIPRGTKKPPAAVLRWRFGPDGCGPIAPRAKESIDILPFDTSCFFRLSVKPDNRG